MKNKGAGRNGLFRILFIALLFVIAMACTPIVRAAGVVSSCNEGSLLTAVSGGGMVTFTCSGTITLTATITIFADTTIDGTGQNVTISGGNAVRVFILSSGVKLNLKKITIANGNTSQSGGGIFNDGGSLTVSNSTFTGNRAGGDGGGIAGTVIVANSKFIDNSATGGGGAIVGAALTISNSTFTDNTASRGGGIWCFGPLNTVANSAFNGNSAVVGGGGINNNGALTVINSTFTDNSAPSGGGGIFDSFGDPSTVTNSTFSGNSSAGVFGSGAIFSSGSDQLTLGNNIIANSPSGGNCGVNYAQLGNAGGNLDTDGTCFGTVSPDPLLGPLQNNGGPTETMSISMASPAFAGANPANCPATDQRGVLRPQFMACDIGAFEFDTANSLLSTVRNNILTLIPTGNQHDQTTLTAVASALAAALNSHNWHGTDGNHLNPSEGEDVFELLVEGASGRLMQLLKASPPSVIPAQTLQTLLNNVTLAGRTLATVAISDSPGGNPTKLAQANALVAKGDADAATGKYISALVNYDIAWSLLHGD